MTIDTAITIFHGLECNPLFSEKHFKAFDMAIASLEAWELVRQEVKQEIESNWGFERIGEENILAIIDKHLQEVENNE